jgi:hypothetical protein
MSKSRDLQLLNLCFYMQAMEREACRECSFVMLVQWKVLCFLPAALTRLKGKGEDTGRRCLREVLPPVSGLRTESPFKSRRFSP